MDITHELYIENLIDSFYKSKYGRVYAVFKNGKQIERGTCYDVYCVMELLKRSWENKEDVYMRLFTEEQIKNKMYDRLFIDIDCHRETENTVEKALEKTRYVYKKMIDAGYRPNVFVSGRGFHIYLLFPETYLSNYRRTVREFVKRIIGKDYRKYIDTAVTGDVKRIARIPYSYNTKANKYMVMIPKIFIEEKMPRNIGETIDDVFVAGLPVENTDLGKELAILDIELEVERRDIDNDLEEERKIKSVYFAKHKDIDSFPPCIKQWITQLIKTGELDHYERVNLASFLLRVWKYDDVKNLFKIANDYNERITEYQLQYIMRRGIQMMSCRRIKEELGACPFKEQKQCVFYPWIETWLRKW